MRQADDIRAQLKEFCSILPPPNSPADDFAMRLQIAALQNHRQELERELLEAERAERKPDPAKTSLLSPASPMRNILPRNVEITGNVTFTNELIVDGKVEGEISGAGVLTVAEIGEIHGVVKTTSVMVFGKVRGNITVVERCELKASAQLVGDVRAGRLVIEEGATFCGRSAVPATQSGLPSKTKPTPEIPGASGAKPLEALQARA